MTGDKAIKTKYKGYTFSSRLEARWAAFFDLLDWKWTYEPVDLKGYIPDFILLFYKPLLVEITPEIYRTDLTPYVDQIQQSGWQNEYCVFGAELLETEDPSSETLALGLLGEVYECDALSSPWRDGDAEFFRCTHCGQYSIHHNIGSYHCRVNGCYDGDHYLGGIDKAEIHELWGQAHAMTRWRK
jgi:hypothetical protein